MSDADDPKTVAWWHARHGAVTSWLLVGPGPYPMTDSAWLHQLAVARGTGDWAIVSQPPLGPLPQRITKRLLHPVGPPGDAASTMLSADGRQLAGAADGDLRDECLRTALDAIARRLQTPVAVADPRQSGLLLLRLRRDGPTAWLDIAPAIREDGWLGRSVGVDLGGARMHWGTSGGGSGSAPLEYAEASFDDIAVSLGDATLELPVAILALTLPAGAATASALSASVEVTLPTLWRCAVPDPVVTLLLEASRVPDFHLAAPHGSVAIGRHRL